MFAPLVSAEARVLSLISPRGIFGGRCGTSAGSCSSGSAAVPRRLSFYRCVTFILLSSSWRSVGPLLGRSSNTLAPRQEIKSFVG